MPESLGDTLKYDFRLSTTATTAILRFTSYLTIMVDARAYHERTKHSPEKLRASTVTLDPQTKPRPYKSYLNLSRVELARIRPPQQPALSAVAHSRADPISGASSDPRFDASRASGDAQSGRKAGSQLDRGRHTQLDRETLATLCYEASGVIERAMLEDGREILFRAASCTGKLYHIDLYPVVGDLDDLAAGVYHFDPQTFSLDVLRDGDYRGVLAEAIRDPAVERAPVTFVTTSTWWRNAWKYRARTYRHAFWDAGTVLANLLAAAHAIDLPASVTAGFADDALVELLGVDSTWEAPIALVPVGGADSETTESDRGTALPESPSLTPLDAETEPVSSDWTEYPLVHDAWKQSTLDDGTSVVDWRKQLSRTVGAGVTTPGGGERIPLDPVGVERQSRRPLYATIRRRRSCRHYASEGPTRRQVGTVLDRAIRGVPSDWMDCQHTGDSDGDSGHTPSERAGLAFNDVYVLSTGVEGVPDGTYQYHPGEAALERLGDVTVEEKRRLALDQGWAGQAHVNVYLLADIDTLVERLGNRGYRLAQLEAGVVLGRLYLATYAHRPLGGTGLTFYDDFVTDHLSPRAADQTPTTLFVFGRAGE